MNKRTLLTCGFFLVFAFFSCKKEDNKPDSPVIPSVTSVSVSTDKACYHPGEEVIFETDKELSSSVRIRYRHLNTLIEETVYTGKTWKWTPPSTDYTGYMVDVYESNQGVEKILGSIAVDVSSDWSRFPRYGFLSEYQEMSPSAIDFVVKGLSRYHINGLQFYDWHFDHHRPLAGTVSNPAAVWKDIANRDNYLNTVKGYIDAAHHYNMKAMFYNLAYGALNNAAADGVMDQWYLYTDAAHVNKDYHALPSPMFKSDIFLTDPSNPQWQQYLAQRNTDVYEVFDFDGFHIDQLGNRNRTLYNYSGTPVDLPSAFHSFIQEMKSDTPDKYLVMNAVNQYGQAEIASAPVDFLYSEVWSPNDEFDDLGRIISENNASCNPRKNTVLAAYMNYDLAGNAGYFNTPGVLLANAVIFALGGAHLELGEHMLAREYFPNNNLQISGQLRDALICYYDFLVAYQNLLRDGAVLNKPEVSSYNSQPEMGSWPPEAGKVAVTGSLSDNCQVLNFINFTSATHLNWRDSNGTQAEPVILKDLKLLLKTNRSVRQIWMASPDRKYGVPEHIGFTVSADAVEFTLPELKYWDMLIVEYE